MAETNKPGRRSKAKQDPKPTEPANLVGGGSGGGGNPEIGALVKFYPPHNKALELVGTLDEIQDDLAIVSVEPDGKILEVSQTYALPLREVRLANDSDVNRHVGDRG